MLAREQTKSKNEKKKFKKEYTSLIGSYLQNFDVADRKGYVNDMNFKKA
jgi:hypothetical protein